MRKDALSWRREVMNAINAVEDAKKNRG